MGVVIAFAFASCSGNKADLMFPDNNEQSGGDAHSGQTVLVLRINTLDNNVSSQDAPEEKINSLRLIIVNSGDKNHDALIEYNQVIDVPETPASLFTYTVTLPIYSGPKQIYVFANETSVPFDNSKNDVDGQNPPKNITEFLDNFKANTNPSDFIAWAETYYFKPEYALAQNGAIYLPYTAYYDNVVAESGKENRITAFLVPVATKFVFNFMNYREAAVEVNGISVSKLNKTNYLFAQVNGDDKYKFLADNIEKKYYWIDWLAEVSERSHNNQGFTSNENFNNIYGWISDYNMPFENTTTGDDASGKVDVSDFQTYVFVNENEKFSVEEVKNDTENQLIPGKYTVGPIYVPESKYLPQYNESENGKSEEGESDNTEDANVQFYYLTLGLHDTGAGKVAPEFKDVVIPNLKALFRNTYVIINVKMSEGVVEAYAEIKPWTKKEAYGYVVEGKAP